ncbi:PAS domain-containing protein [Bowmanella yangjiangensis]|uniref:PAS domain-containing protein n=1 Tax=Bowmanella yangjiangensis TaxID=2811230 RepID=A0ABS3CNN2_9ALTE|nr:PAS domain-containing protein [Bowmanella yangjiangensis]MBN7818722.1 PAS domain-containing protein [Bowmanella yangjiangensis]
MSNALLSDMTEFHWMMDMLQTVDVGLVVLDRHFKVKLWNGFMESHSGLLPSQVREKCLFDLFPEIDQKWFTNKSRPVFELRNRAFIIWEQRPYLLRFSNYRPLTGTEDFMYQNITLSPLASTTGQVDNICMMIYDVTDVAASKKLLESTQVTLSEWQERT